MSLRRFVVILSENTFKLREFQRAFDKYGIDVIQRAPLCLTEAERELHRVGDDDRVRVMALLREQTRLWKEGTEEPVEAVKSNHLVFADNVSTMTVTRPKTKKELRESPADELSTTVEKEYTYKTTGYIDFTRREAACDEADATVAEGESLPGVFGFDDVFVPRYVHRSYDELRQDGLKYSSRDMVIGQYLKDSVYYRKRANLKHSPQQVKRSIDFSNPVAKFLDGNAYMSSPQAEAYGLRNVCCHVANQGVFFRAAQNRREKTYWLPGLNAGLPYTPKKDPIHEITYLAHDVGHFMVPDLIFTGQVTRNRRRTYIAWRLMSEAVTMSMADMVFVDSIAKSGVDYDFSKRRIFPLMQDAGFDLTNPSTFPDTVRSLLKANVSYCLHGDDSVYREHMAANGVTDPTNLDLYKEKYMPFFVEDYRWTDRNFDHLADRCPEFARWWDMVSCVREAHGLHLLTIEEAMAAIDVTDDTEISSRELVSRVFQLVMTECLEPGWLHAGTVTALPEELRRAKAFARYMMGQLMLFSRYHCVTDASVYRDHLLDFVTSNAGAMSLEDIDHARGFYEHYVQQLVNRNLLSMDDGVTYKEVFPLFDPFFVFYDRKLEDYQQLDELSSSILDREE